MQRRSYTKPIIRVTKDHDRRSRRDLIRLSVEHPAPIISEVMEYNQTIHEQTNTEFLVIRQMLDNYERQTGVDLIREALDVLSNKHHNDSGEYAIRRATEYLQRYLYEHAISQVTPANYREFFEGGSRNMPSAQDIYGIPKSVRSGTVNRSPSFSEWINSVHSSSARTIDDPHDDDADATSWSLPGDN